MGSTAAKRRAGKYGWTEGADGKGEKSDERSQLIVTTHSDMLVDALTNEWWSIVVCEKRDGQTVMRRLDKKKMVAWLGTIGSVNSGVVARLGGILDEHQGICRERWRL